MTFNTKAGGEPNPFANIAANLVGAGEQPQEEQVLDDQTAASTSGEQVDGLNEAEGSGESPQAEQDDSASETKEPLHTVVVNGKSEAVPLSELIAGYQRNADYSEKTRAVASERKQVEAAKAEVGTLQKQYVERLTALEAALRSQLPTQDAMNMALQRNDTASYLKMQQQLAQFNQIMGERSQTEARMSEAQKAEQAARLESESQALMAKLPEYAKEEANTKLRNYLVGQGWDAEEVASIADHRAIVTAHKAMLWDELQAKKPDAQKRVEGMPKLNKPGARQNQATVQQHEFSQAMKTLQATGRLDNAEQRSAVFGRFL